MRKPRVYLLDEPIAHLDAKLKFSTQTLLREFAVNYGSTIIYVTHDYREALALSDRMMVLRKGKIDQIGTPEEIYHNPKVDYVGMLIGEPPMNMVDGLLINQNSKTLFKAGSLFEFELSKDAALKAEKYARNENNSLYVRLGIRCENIKVSDKKMSDDSFQLPVYAVIHEAESSVVTFELEKSFLHSKISRGKGYESCHTGEKVWLEFDQENICFFEKTVEISKA